MKTKIILGIALALLFVILFIPQRAAAGDTLNPCWTMFYPNDPAHGYNNSDSVLYDSCLCDKPSITDCKYNYAKKYFRCFLPYWALWIPKAPRDTIILKTWQEIDTTFKELRDSLEKIEIKYGKYFFQKYDPNNIDSNSLGSSYFYILFYDYQNISDIKNSFQLIPEIKTFDYWNRAVHFPDGYIEENKNITITIELSYDNLSIIIQNIDINIEMRIKIYNYLGIIIYSQNNLMLNQNSIQINTSKFETGIYFLQVNNKTFKILITR